MKVIDTQIPLIKVFEPQVFEDERGYFFESCTERRLAEVLGRPIHFVQDNHSLSHRGVLRGLHYQLAPSAQAKLIRVIRGEILDVVVDMRRSSPTFARWVSERMSSENRRQMWVPEGFAHGFVTLSEHAEVEYKVTNYYDPDAERAIHWNDPDIGIAWGLDGEPLLSAKDAAADALCNAELFD